MALLHQAQIHPSKLELIQTWLDTTAWFTPGPEPLTLLGAYRFDDPDGEVGIETHLVTTGAGPVIQAPVTYRGAPLEGADTWLMGTTEHTVLGRRWVYDGCGDPVYVAALATAILTGGVQAKMMVQVGDHQEERVLTTTVAGGGEPRTPVPSITAVDVTEGGPEATISAGGLDLVFRRLLVGAPRTDPARSLTGSWPGQDERVVLAHLA